MGLTPARVLLAAIGLTFIGLLIDAFVAPAAHPVHGLGGTSITAVEYESTDALWWVPSDPTESLAGVQCYDQIERKRQCTPAFIAAAFPGLSQADHTLYVVWSGCAGQNSAPGFNIEYFASSRTLVLHCYVATPWLYFHSVPEGVQALHGMTLLAIPTAGIGPGTLRINEDDRREHLALDQSNEYPLGTATIK